MNIFAHTPPSFFSSKDNRYNEKTMVNRIISRTDSITAKELGIKDVSESPVQKISKKVKIPTRKNKFSQKQ